MKKLLLTSFLGLLLHAAAGQSYFSIAGYVSNASSREPLEFATIQLKNLQDSLILQNVFSDTSGHFMFENVVEGSYLIMVSNVGYETTSFGPYSLKDKDFDTGNLLIKQNTRLLNEVVVKGERAAIERQADRIIMNVASNSIYKTSINALDVLKKAPGLMVSPDGGITLGNNINPKVFIDGKDVPMSAMELKNYLNTLGPDLIETIEIITSPSSRYDSQYRAIINIRLKRDKNLGLSGSYTGTYRQHRFGDLSNSLNLTYKTRKLAFTSVLGKNFGQGYYQYDGVQNLAGGSFLDTFTDVISKANSLPVRLGLDVFFSKKHSAGITYRFFDRNEIKDNKTENQITEQQSSDFVTLQKTGQYSEPKDRNNSVNAYYTGNFGKSTLDFLGTIARYNSEEHQSIITKEQEELTEQLKSGISGKIDIRSSQIDFKTPLLKGNFETGAKIALTHTDNDVKFDILKENGFETDPLRTNHFIYKERIMAGYVNYAGNYKKLSYQAGLRVENTDSDARSSNSGEPTLRNYTQWLPTASVTWTINQNNTTGLSYTSRLRRPNFEELNPFQFYISPFTYAEGNPFLLPERSNTLEWTYSFKNYGFSLKTGQNDNNIQQVPYYNPSTHITRYYRENIKKAVFHAFAFNGSNTIKKWWNLQYYTGVSAENNYYFINNETINKYVLSAYAGLTQAFTLKNNWAVDNSLFYYAGGGDAIYKVLPFGNVNFGIQKTLLNNNLVLKCNFDDVFNSGNQSIRSNRPEIIDTRFIQYYGSRKVRLQLIYKFGKSTYKGKQNRRTDEENRAG